jgi:transcriptional regulator with XRE-family HTH domain
LTENHIIMSVLIGKIIQQRRKQLKITQPLLAELAEVNVNTIYRIERNEANPTIQILNKILEVLGMELKIEVKKIN